MKKIINSLLMISTFFAAILFTACDFNLSENQFLERPDVTIKSNCFQIRGSYISNSTVQITIYRQNVQTSDNGNPIERVAILFPSGDEDEGNQTFIYEDERVITNTRYRYYLRFTDKNGEKNRTEWSEPKMISNGAGSLDQIAYTVNCDYTYDPTYMTLTLPSGRDFTAPDDSVIKDITSYKPALVFQVGDMIQSFELPGAKTNEVSLKSLLPREYLYNEISLLGIVGQKSEKNSSNSDLLKTVSWTNLTPIKIVDSHGIRLKTIRLDPEFGEAGFDYTSTSDNEN